MTTKREIEPIAQPAANDASRVPELPPPADEPGDEKVKGGGKSVIGNFPR